MLQDTQIHRICNFGGVRECWLAEKWLEPQKNEIHGFCRLDNPPKIFDFFDIIVTVTSLPTFLCKKFSSNVFVLSSKVVGIDATGFLAYAKTGFSPETTSQVRATCLKRCGAVSRIGRCLHRLSSLIRSDIMADHNFEAHYSLPHGDRINTSATQILDPKVLTKWEKSRLSKHMRSGSGEVPVAEGLHPISHWPHARSNRMLAREHYPKISSLLLRQLASRKERSRWLLRKRTLFPATPFDFCAFFKRSWAKNRFWSFMNKTSNHTGLPPIRRTVSFRILRTATRERNVHPIHSSKYGKPVVIHHTIPCDKATSFILSANV